MDRWLAALSLVFFTFILALFFELLSPSGIRVVLVGSGVRVIDIPDAYSRLDVAIAAASAFAAGASASAILLRSPRGIHAPRLGESERRVYEFLLKRGGEAYQSEICEELGLSKSSVSEIVRRLELSGLVEVKREGGRNLVTTKLGA